MGTSGRCGPGDYTDFHEPAPILELVLFLIRLNQ